MPDDFQGCNNIRIFNGCEVLIENSVTRVTVRHHKASVTRVTVRHHETCRVMPNSYPSDRNFQFAPTNHYGFFFLPTLHSTIAFRLEYVLFYECYAKITTFFDQEKKQYVDAETFSGN